MSHYELGIFGPQRLFYRSPNVNVVLAARIEGRLNREGLRAAIAKASEVHPLMRVRTQITDSQWGFFTSEGVQEDWQLQTYESKSWKEAVLSELRTLHDIHRGPMIRFGIVDSQETSILIINAHHSICDAFGLVFVLKDILTHLGNPDKPPRERIEPLEISQDIVPVSLKGNPIVRFYFGRINRKWRRSEIDLSELDSGKLHPLFLERFRHDILKDSFNEEETERVVKYAKKNDVTVGSIILTSLIASQREMQPDLEYRDEIVVTRSIRDMFLESPGESLSYYVTSIRPKLKYNQSKSFRENLVQFHKRSRRLLSKRNAFGALSVSLLDPEVIDALHFRRFGLLQNDTLDGLMDKVGVGRWSKSLCYTNLGKLTIPIEYGALRLVEVLGPFVASDTMEKYVGVVTLDNRMSITMIYEENVLPKKLAQRIFERAIELAKGLR